MVLVAPRSGVLTAPVTSGRWIAPGASPGVPLRVAVLGDSLAAGVGVHAPDQTLPVLAALSLSRESDRPVELTSTAVPCARSRDLRRQLETLVAAPDVALVVVGANDVTHRVAVAESVRHLTLTVHRLRLLGAQVVVGCCPDLGSAPRVPGPLRGYLTRHARALATAQAHATRRCDGVPVDLFAGLGVRFRTDPRLFGPDGYHPSAAGYHAGFGLLGPALLAAWRSESAAGRAA